MLGLGETKEEILKTMDDLREAGCQVFTLGQYLQPTLKHMPVEEYIHPDQFACYREEAASRGFSQVESSPLVRSSYHAEKHVTKLES
jgi:lipoic acid synthetase